MKNLNEEKIKVIVEDVLEEYKDLFLVDVKVKGNVGNQKVLVFIDGDEGLNIDQCSMVSRRIGAVMEEEDLVPEKHVLEVSSPGLDHPITLPRQYVKNKGRSLKVETMEREIVEGELVEVGEHGLILRVKENERTVDFKDINQSRVIISFK